MKPIVPFLAVLLALGAPIEHAHASAKNGSGHHAAVAHARAAKA